MSLRVTHEARKHKLSVRLIADRRKLLLVRDAVEYAGNLRNARQG